MLTFIAAAALAGWIYLVFFRGFFWRAGERLERAALGGNRRSLRRGALRAPWLRKARRFRDGDRARAARPYTLDASARSEGTPAAIQDPPAAWPDIVAVIPARNEAPVIGAAVTSLLQQDYPAEIRIIVVDDASDDGTAAAARAAAERIGADGPLEVIAAPPLPAGWSGKLWAVHNGLAAAPADRRYVLLTDADIVHAKDAVRRLVAQAERGFDLVSLMVKLRCESAAERLLIPAFVFFFQKLYPFPWVNDPARRMAGAAGGCMLVRQAALDRAGGIAAIKGALIDDCALAAAIKKSGAIWLGLADASVSLRGYPRIADVWRMVARTAYTQLRHSPALVAGTALGMVLLYLAPSLTLVLGLAFGAWIAAGLGAAAFALMLFAYWPTWKLYRGRHPGLVLLPLAALLYTCMTVDSALQHRRGKGGAWKGRTYASAD